LSEKCKHNCEDGWLIDESTNTARHCHCQLERVRTRHIRAVLRELPRSLNNLSFESTPINNLDPEIQAALKRYVKYHKRKMRDGRGLWIQGDPGTGKTAAIALVAKNLTEKGHTILVRSVPVLLSDIRALQAADDERDWIHMRDDLIALDVLGLDDLGAEVPSPWALERLYEIINEREARRDHELRSRPAQTSARPADRQPPLRHLRQAHRAFRARPPRTRRVRSASC
jgi:DNA replication protein DnaC